LEWRPLRDAGRDQKALSKKKGFRKNRKVEKTKTKGEAFLIFET
jgi:hypothetical protein